ncbi:MAG TPA: hypothetical protein VKP30_19285 [Polyangiaceae bacterium]|nr:hypothetical protein [Polyangiaceae bacterium]
MSSSCLSQLGSVKELERNTGFFNLTRQLGGSIGVALLATIISNRQAVHRGVLVEWLNPARRVAADHLAQVTEKFASQGEPLARAHQSAVTVLDGLVERQALIRAFDDAFLVTLLIVLFALPLLLLLGKPRPLGQARPRWSRS